MVVRLSTIFLACAVLLGATAACGGTTSTQSGATTSPAPSNPYAQGVSAKDASQIVAPGNHFDWDNGHFISRYVSPTGVVDDLVSSHDGCEIHDVYDPHGYDSQFHYVTCTNRSTSTHYQVQSGRSTRPEDVDSDN